MEKRAGVEEILKLTKKVYKANKVIWYDSLAKKSIHYKVAQAISKTILRGSGEEGKK